MKHTISSSLFALCLAVTAHADAPKGKATGFPELAGRWRSIACELRPAQGGGDMYLRRAITFTDKKIDVEFKVFEDSGCTKPKLTLFFTGAVEVVGPSTVATGAHEVNLHIDTVDLQPASEGVAAFLGSGGPSSCGPQPWKAGARQRISDTGCKPFALPPKTITHEYEVLAVDHDVLFFGARPVDGTSLDAVTKRPHALQVPLERVR